jgi:hypothetical protein
MLEYIFNQMGLNNMESTTTNINATIIPEMKLKLRAHER